MHLFLLTQYSIVKEAQVAKTSGEPNPAVALIARLAISLLPLRQPVLGPQPGGRASEWSGKDWWS